MDDDAVTLPAESEAFAVASFLMISGLLKRFAKDSQQLRALCREALGEALADAERGKTDLHAQAFGLIQGLLSVQNFRDPGGPGSPPRGSASR